MTIIVVLFVLVVIMSIFVAIANAQKTNAVKSRVESRYALDEKFVSPVDQCVIGLNFDEEKILLGDGRTEGKYDFSQIVSVEVIENETTITNTNRGSQLMGAVAGGLLFGGVGALVGGMSGSTRSRAAIRGIALKIVVDSRVTPNYTIWFFKTASQKGISRDSILIKSAIQQIERMHAQLLNAMRRAKEKAPHFAFSPGPHTDALRKLWDLKQAGVLTDDEFTAQKTLLLASGNATPGFALTSSPPTQSMFDVVLVGFENKIEAIKSLEPIRK